MSFLDLDVGMNREGGEYKWNECGVGENKVEKRGPEKRALTDMTHGNAKWNLMVVGSSVDPYLFTVYHCCGKNT